MVLSCPLGRLAVAFAALGLLGCGGDADTPSGQGGAAGTPGATNGPGATGSAGVGAEGTSSGAGGAAQGAGGGGDPGAEICARWNADRADLGEGKWSGAVDGCDPGDISGEGRANALKIANLYRFIAKLPAVATDGTRDQKAQACALMMQANMTLSHSPPPSWTCYSGDGAEAAGSSNISPTPGVAGVDLYMADPGNDTTMGHRRWILSGSLGPVGLGSTDAYSCMWVVGGGGSDTAEFTAWPSPGPFPVEAMTASFASVDTTGWTIQSSTIDLGGAQVSIDDGGEDRPMAVSTLEPNYGSTFAIRMVPQGWTAQPGHTYSVSVAGLSKPIAYEVIAVSCK